MKDAEPYEAAASLGSEAPTAAWARQVLANSEAMGTKDPREGLGTEGRDLLEQYEAFQLSDRGLSCVSACCLETVFTRAQREPMKTFFHTFS